MGLRDQAQLDARAILEDTSGFAWPITLTSPLGVVTSLKGFTTDVGQTIDPETGQAVAGRRASAVVSLSSLPAMPEAVAERNRKPWLARFADSTGAVASWKVVDVMPDRAAGVVVLILEAFQPAIVVLTGRLMLPSLRLAGSATPMVGALAGAVTLPRLQLVGTVVWYTLSGALALPPLQLAGSISPAVALSGALVLPHLQLAGSATPRVAALGGALVLPHLQLAGSATPHVAALSGALVLPSLRLAGSISPAVTLSGALVLPSLHLAGSISPTVRALGGALVLPSLHLAGSLAWFTLGGALVLPSLHLAGSISPTVRALSGTLALPLLQVAGSAAPKVTMGGALTLPEVQLSGSFTTGAFVQSAWLRVANATSDVNGVSSVPDILNSNPAVQATNANKPALTSSANGLPCLSFATANFLLWPIAASNDNVNTLGIGFWLKPTSLGFLNSYAIHNFASQATADQVKLGMDSSGRIYSTAFVSGVNGRQGRTPASVYAAATWIFVTLEYFAAGASEAAKLIISANGVVQSLTFINDGSGGTIGTLVAATGNILLGQEYVNGQNQYLGLIGPNIWMFTSRMAAATQGLLTSAARTAFMNFDKPT